MAKAKAAVSYTKQAAHGTIIILVGILAAAFIAYLTRVVLAKKLSLEEFGLFYAVLTFVLFFYIFKDLGLGEAISKFIPEFNAKKEYGKIKATLITSFSIQLISSFIFAFIFFVLSNFLAEHYFKNPQASILLKLLSLMLILNVFDDTLRRGFHGFQKMNFFSAMEFTKNLITLLLILLFFYFDFKIFSPAVAYIIASPIIFFIFAPFFLKKFNLFKYKTKSSKKLTKSLVFYGLPALLTMAASNIVGYIDVLMLTYFRTLGEVGLYNVVLPTAMLCLYIGRAVSIVMIPMSSELWAKKEYKKLSEGLKKLQKYTFIVTIPAILILISFSELYLKVIFGTKFVAAALSLQIILIGTIFFTVARINHSVLAGIGKPKVVTKIVIVAALINFVANLILIPPFGISGAAAATSLSYIFMLFLSNYKASKLIKMKVPWLELGKIFLCGLILILAIFYLKSIISLNVWAELIIISISSIIIYILLIFLFRIISLTEIKDLLKSVL